MPPQKPPSTADLNRLIKAQLSRQPKAVERDEFDQLAQNVEKLGEDLGQANVNSDAIREYIRSLTADVNSGRSARFYLSAIATGLVLSAMASFLYLILCPTGRIAFAALQDTHVKIAVIVALFGMSFGLLALMVKGAYHRGQAAQVPDIMPDHIKLFFESMKNLPGKP